MRNQNLGLQEALSSGNLPHVAYAKKRGGGHNAEVKCNGFAQSLGNLFGWRRAAGAHVKISRVNKNPALILRD